MDNWTSTREPLFILASAGHERWTGGDGYLHDCRLRPPPRRVVLQLTLAGAAFHQRGGRRSLVTPGKAILDILPGAWSYGWAPESNGPYEQVFVACMGDPAFELADRIIARFGNVVEPGRDAPMVTPMLRLARQFTRGETTDRYLVSARIYEICMSLFSTLGRRQASACPVTAGTLQLIRESSADPRLNVAAMAKALGCSRSHLTRRFHAATATTPLEYLLQFRLDRASAAIRDSDDPIQTIAAAHGFAGSNYFCRVFRQRFGLPPRRWRMSFRG